MQIIKYPNKDTWSELLKRPSQSLEDMEDKVMAILQDVKLRGDEALQLFSEKFDGVKLEKFSVSKNEIQDAEKLVSNELKEAIKIAYDNIYKFHLHQVETKESIETMPGVDAGENP